MVMPDLIRHPLPLGRHAGLDPASTFFFSNRAMRAPTPEPQTIVMPDLIRHPPSSPTAAREKVDPGSSPG
jgi:hypothetical protein